MHTANRERAIRHRFILATGLAFFVMTSMAGPFRMYLSMIGLSPLIYVPNLMMLVAIAWHSLLEPSELGFGSTRLVTYLVLAYGALLGVLFTSPTQVAMGIYVLVPFWFGLTCAYVFVDNLGRMKYVIALLWLIISVGVLVNKHVDFPWEGFGYAVGDLDVDGSRQWYAAGGVKRAAGFSRASFDAAGQIVILAIVLTIQTKGALLRLLIWCTSFAAVIPTNSKGMMLAALVLTPIILLRSKLPQTPLRALPLLFGILGLALPTSVLLVTFDSQFNNPTLANATFSFYDRLNRMWPEAWSLVVDHGNTLMGRGFGGIGTAQNYFESDMVNAGDNIFMYWFVIFGWAALPGFLLILLRTLQVKPHKNETEFVMYCLLMAVLVYGTMVNIVENAILALVCGIVLRWLNQTRSRPSCALSLTSPPPTHQRIAAAT